MRLRRLAGELRRLRVEAGMRQEFVAGRTGLDASSIYRIERAMNRPQRRTVTTLLDLYGVTDPERRDTLLSWLKDSGEPLWFRSYEPFLRENYQVFLGLEHEAERVRSYEPLVVPGLLQTEGYARALIGDSATVDAEPRIEIRMRRQAVLHRPVPLRFHTVVDEAVIRRPVGGPAVMREQLTRLATAAPHITVQVVPFEAGPYPAMVSGFTIMEFADPSDAPVVHCETVLGDTLLEDEAELARFTGLFEAAAGRALPPAESADLIRRAAAGLG
jgi:transcriptional regulator with XRE-family HTH domain